MRLNYIEELYMLYKKDIYLYLMSLTHNHTLSEDLLSETFIRAIKCIPTFKGKSSVKTWLFGIARNVWLQHLRSHRVTVEYDDLIEVYVKDNLEDGIITKETIKRMKELLDQKEERVKKIVWMRVDGIPFGEIAKKLNISENSARVIDFRTKQELKTVLKKEGYL